MTTIIYRTIKIFMKWFSYPFMKGTHLGHFLMTIKKKETRRSSITISPFRLLIIISPLYSSRRRRLEFISLLFRTYTVLTYLRILSSKEKRLALNWQALSLLIVEAPSSILVSMFELTHADTTVNLLLSYFQREREREGRWQWCSVETRTSEYDS